ncbi:Type-1 restriction enzyme EcoKI specificity protein [Pontiella desulfatans]|uniref:Type-1 restriction enzyme EcoKI specificity protein n=1 Tax=Pontiella desulfatans TaxID=2750659 RepID=A0A6C2TYF1_PONDE|nr:restriction endonuclease subunit S [Pontiella desulfatans]VGO12710.1 Type-1 restriction enzyme EcoKI specificity protein [Pontiella desulfatans]
MSSNGWKKGRMKDCIAGLESGVSVNGLDRTPEANEAAVLKVSAVTYGYFDEFAAKPISGKELTRANCTPKKDSIIISRASGSPKHVGASAYVPADYPNRFLSDKLWQVTANDLACPQWLFALVSSPRMRAKMLMFATGTNIKNITKSEFLEIKISIPPLEEQKAIADVLSTWDRAISTTERLIQAKEKKLDAYGRSLFDRNQNGKYPGWELIKLADVLDEHGDKSAGKEEVFSVSVHKGLVNQIEHLGRSFSAAKTDHYNRVHHGDIVYTKSPTGDFPWGIVKQSYTPEDVIVSPLYGVFTPQTHDLGIVLDFYFSSPTRATNYLFPIVQKGAKNTIAITNKTFLSKKLHLPTDKSEQKKVAEYVVTARKEIDLLKKLAAKYKAQKRGLMQKLLTGTWRVNIEEAVK